MDHQRCSVNTGPTIPGNCFAGATNWEETLLRQHLFAVIHLENKLPPRYVGTHGIHVNAGFFEQLAPGVAQ